MSPIPSLAGVTQLSVLEAADAVGYVAIGYLLCGLLNNYFAYHRQWVLALLLAPLSASITGKGAVRGGGLLSESGNVDGGEDQAYGRTTAPNRREVALKEGPLKRQAEHRARRSTLPATPAVATLKLLSRNLESGGEGAAHTRNAELAKTVRRHKQLQGSLLTTVKV